MSGKSKQTMKKPKRYAKMSRFEVLALVAYEIERAGSLRKYAKQIGVSPAYLSDAMRGRRNPGPSILRAFDLKCVITPGTYHYEAAKRV